jgi:hypothetical protein
MENFSVNEPLFMGWVVSAKCCLGLRLQSMLPEIVSGIKWARTTRIARIVNHRKGREPRIQGENEEEEEEEAEERGNKFADLKPRNTQRGRAATKTI